MKAIVCEMCGSQDVVKQAGVYVCQHCGTKYDPEEAKKLLVEVSGAVEIDNTRKIENLYQLARRARDDANFKDAADYYQQIAIEKPDDWEANFYKVFCRAVSGENKDAISHADNVANTLSSTAELLFISSNLSEIEKKNEADKIETCCWNLITALAKYATALIRAEQFTASKAVSDSQIRLAVAIGGFTSFYDEEHAFEAYDFAAKYTKSPELRETAIKRAKQIKPDYVPEEDSTKSDSGGCYVATAVYGSYDCPEVWTLRRYRDYTLAETWYGRAFIHTYYAISPTLVKWFGNTVWFKNMWKPKLDKMVERLNREGVADTPYQDSQW